MVDTNNRVLVTGATGQIGSELITKLQSMYGEKISSRIVGIVKKPFSSSLCLQNYSQILLKPAIKLPFQVRT